MSDDYSELKNQLSVCSDESLEMQALDAIESLQARVEELREQIKRRKTILEMRLPRLVRQRGELQVRVEELEAELERHRWILVSERLPETNKQVIVLLTTDRRVNGDGHYNGVPPQGHDWPLWSTDEGFDLDVTHWMPLPDPPEDEQRRT